MLHHHQHHHISNNQSASSINAAQHRNSCLAQTTRRVRRQSVTHAAVAPRSHTARTPSRRCIHAAASASGGSQPLWETDAAAAAIVEQQPGSSSTTTWQQRQKQIQRQQQGGYGGPTKRQQKQQLKQQTEQQPTPARPDTTTGSLARQFAACQSFATLRRCIQQLVQAQQQQQQADAATNALDAEQQQPEQQQQPPPPPPPVLSTQDCVALINQLAVLAAASNASISSSVGGGGVSSGSSSVASVSGANQFVEDQALQQLLAVVYAQLDVFVQQHQHQHQQQPGSVLLSPEQLLQCVSTLAGLKYTQPVQLGLYLHAAAVHTGAARTQPMQQPDGYRQVLGSLSMSQLSGLVWSLGRTGVRPNNTWLLAFMQVAQQKLPQADLLQLAQLLSGLVKVGVKPTTAWLDSLEARAIQCLLQHSLKQQVAADQQQYQQQQGTEVSADVSSGAGSSRGDALPWQRLPQKQPQQQQSPRGGGRGRSRGAGRGSTGSRSPNNRPPAASTSSCQLQHVAQLLIALSEAKHPPRPQLAAVLWGATAGSLASADSATLVELVTALGELQLVPPAAWLQQYFIASSTNGVLATYRPWQLASSIAAVGRLAVAAGGSQQGAVNSLDGAAVWADALLGAVQQQLPSFAARDLAALLSGLAALRLQLRSSQVQLLLSELQGKLPRLNTAGLADVAEAVLAFSTAQQQHQTEAAGRSGGQDMQMAGQQQQQQAQTTADFREALLREVAVKLPVFPADDLARVLLAVAAAPPAEARPSQLWLQAAAAQLSSKLTLLAPATLLAVLDAFVTLGCPPDQQWVLQAAAAIAHGAAGEGLTELTATQLQRLLALLVTLRVAPPVAWLDRAAWAVQQTSQAQQRVQAADDDVGSADCEDLLSQLREMQQQQKEEVAKQSSDGPKASAAPEAVAKVQPGS